MSLVIRTADENDLLAVLDVGHRTWPVTYGPIAGDDYVAMGLAKWWTKEGTLHEIVAGRVTVAEVDREVEGRLERDVVGVASAGPHEGQLALWKLYVLPEHQGKGIGSALFESVLARATGHYSWIRLSYMEGNTSAETFYRAKGFVEVGRDSGGNGIPESIWLQLDLDTREL